MIKKMNKLVRILDKIINTFVTLILIFFILIGSYALYDTYNINESAKLNDDILALKPKKGETTETFSLKDLKKINDNIVGWITIDDTNIDYPILYAKDNTKYLDLDYHDEYSSAGSIFLDYRNDNFTDDYSIIYGHHMSNDRMFSDITKFSEINYFNSHKTGKLYTDSGVYNLEIYNYAIVNAFDDKIYNLSIFKNEKNSTVIDFLKNNSVFKRELDFEDKKILLLSTCNAEMKNDREVLLAKITLDTEQADIIEKQNNENTKDPESIIKINSEQEKEYKERFNIFGKLGLTILLSVLVAFIYIILIIKLKNKKKKRGNTNS